MSMDERIAKLHEAYDREHIRRVEADNDRIKAEFERDRYRRAMEHHRHAIEQPGLYPQFPTDDDVSEHLWRVLDE